LSTWRGGSYAQRLAGLDEELGECHGVGLVLGVDLTKGGRAQQLLLELHIKLVLRGDGTHLDGGLQVIA